MTSVLEAAVLRTLAWFMVIGYTPLYEEVVQDIDVGASWAGAAPTQAEIRTTLLDLIAQKKVIDHGRRLVLPTFEALFAEQARRERVFPRKWRRIQRLVAWLKWIPSIRCVAVCNTTALGSARDLADIDLFFVVRRGTLWLTRGCLALAAAFAFRRPGQRHGEQDAWCFSFFIDDTHLDLERFVLPEGDPYLGFWTRHLLLVLDDGVSESLWEAQRFARRQQPFAGPWIAWRTIPSRAKPVARWVTWIDGLAMRVQQRLGSRALWQRSAQGGSEVVLDAHTFKTHTEDRRQEFRSQYEALCTQLGITS